MTSDAGALTHDDVMSALTVIDSILGSADGISRNVSLNLTTVDGPVNKLIRRWVKLKPPFYVTVNHEPHQKPQQHPGS